MNRSEYYAIALLSWAGVLVVVTGANARFLSAREGKSPPHGRVGCFASPTLGTNYRGPGDLGEHGYEFNLTESSGIVYTARGGHVDIVHVRKAADWTAYLAYQTRSFLLHDITSFSYRMAEPTKYHVRITYPEAWASLPPDVKRETAERIAVRLGQYFAFAGTTWHEIITWFGFKSIGLYSEFPSAFSWEDSYSNLLGTYLGARALLDPDHEYNEAFTLLLDEEMDRLQIQPRRTAYEAGSAVRNKWFVGNYFFTDMIRRNLDIGTDDGYITPWLVSEVVPSLTGSMSYPVPDLDFLDDYGFSVTFEIEPKEWERNKVLRLLREGPKDRPDRIEPARHFGPIMAYIRAQAIRHYGPRADRSGIAPAPQTQYAADVMVRPAHLLAADALLDGDEKVDRAQRCREIIRTHFAGRRYPGISEVAVFAACWLVEEPSFTMEVNEERDAPQELHVAHRAGGG